MGTNREARILGACETIEVGKVEYKLRPVVAQHLCDLEIEALRHYKRQYLQTFAENADLLGKQAQATIDREMMRVARWDLLDLPQKEAFDTSRIPVTDKLREWVEENYGDPQDDGVEGEDKKEAERRGEVRVRSLLATALDTERITPEKVKKLASKGPLRGRVRYDQWWVTASTNGMISFILSSVRHEHPEITKEDVAGWSFDKIAEASRKVEKITSAEMGNT